MAQKPRGPTSRGPRAVSEPAHSHDHTHGHDHGHEHAHDHHHAQGHDHGHDHAHGPRVDHDSRPLGGYEALAEAINMLLLEKGILTDAEIAQQIDIIESRTPALGAKIVARAWVDPSYRQRLLADARAALLELGVDFGQLAELKVVESTPETHNMVVCTLCSCYPKMLLGIPPAWYKNVDYRSRAVRDPRGVLTEFGVHLADDVRVRVHDSTADLRYLVLPLRPSGTESWTEAELARIVTRDAMIGVAIPQSALELD